MSNSMQTREATLAQLTAAGMSAEMIETVLANMYGKAERNLDSKASITIADGFITVKMPFDEKGSSKEDGKMICHASSGGFKNTGVLVNGKMLQLNFYAGTKK